MTALDAAGAGIEDLTGIEYSTDLTQLELFDNQISDIYPIVSNAGIDDGDWVTLACNALEDTSIYEHIPALQARGVDVYWLPPDSIYCPEPSCALLLVSGAGLLSVLHRRRR